LGFARGCKEHESKLARNYANWDKVQAYWKHQSKTKPPLKEVSKGTIVFYTSPVVGSPGRLEHDISKTRSLLLPICRSPNESSPEGVSMPQVYDLSLGKLPRIEILINRPTK
jgi:hypothetical protein